MKITIYVLSMFVIVLAGLTGKGLAAENTVSGDAAIRASTAQVGTLLLNLQPQLEQLTIALQSVNSARSTVTNDIPNTSPPQGNDSTPPTQPTPTSGVNFGRNAAANTSSRDAMNFGVNASVPAGSAPAAQPAQTPLVRTGGTGPQAEVGLEPPTSRSLVLLQQELQRLLPLVARVNNDPGFQQLVRDSAKQVPPAVAPATSPLEIPSPAGRPTGRPAPPGNLRITPR